MQKLLGSGWILFLFFIAVFQAQEKKEELVPEPYEKGVPVEILPEIRRLFQEAGDFPKSNAKTACKRLTQYGEIIIPSMDYYLKKGSWRHKVAMAFIAEDLNSKALFQGLTLAAQDPEVSSYLKYFFEALLISDFIPAQQVLLSYLKNPKNAIRWLATRTLEPILHKDMEPILMEYLRSRDVPYKSHVIALLGIYHDPKFIPEFLPFLGHDSQEICLQAALELSKFNQQDLLKKLIENLDHADFRVKGYSLLTLILLQDQFKTQLFDEVLFKKVLKDLRHPQDFIRYTSAIALCSINDYDMDLELSQQDEINVLNNLIQCCMGNKFFKDYQSIRSLGLEKLQKVSGKNFRADPIEWKKWWEENQGIFRIVKRLKEVQPSAVERVRVFFETEGNESQNYLFSVEAVDSLAKQFPLAKIRILAASDMLQLMNKLKENDFFEMRANYGVTESNVGWLRTIKVSLESQERIVTVRTGFHHQEFETIEIIVEELIRKNTWQQYWSKGFNEEWRDWWYANYQWFQGTSEFIEIHSRLKTLIIENLSYSLTRERDLQDLKNIILEMQQSPEVPKEGFEALTVWELSRLVQFIVQQPQLSGTSDFFIECICLSQNEKVLEPLFGYLLKPEIYSPKARVYLGTLIESFGRNAVLRYLIDSDWRLRSASAEVAWKEQFSNDLEIQAYLRKRLSVSGIGVETNPSVRQSLIYALGLTGKTQSEEKDRMEELYISALRKLQKRPKIDEALVAEFQDFTKLMVFRYENMNPEEQKKIISALQALFGVENVSFSQEALNISPASNLDFKMDALVNLKQVIDITKNWDVTLLEEQLKTNDPSIIRSTITALGHIGTERALGLITDFLGNADPSYRTEAVKALGVTKKSKYLISVINGLLRDPSQRVNQIASQVLVEWGSEVVQENLLRELKACKIPEKRQVLIETLSKFAKKEALPELKPYLEDEDFRVRVLTASFFAQFQDLSVIPLLIESIGKSDDYTVFQALSILTCQNFKGSSENIALRYKNWWEENHLLAQRHWFFNSLKEEGYPVDELLEYTSGNDKDIRGVPILLKALKDPHWYLRYNASVALENISGITNNRSTQQTSPEEREIQIRFWYQWWEKLQNK
ncbi:MAG: HEAT repeat domain-containing protein [Planctomycetota bacterium]